MARPTKNSCDYFPHDTGMRNHPKVRAIRNKFDNGYSIWSMLLEFLTGSDGNVFEYSELQFELLSGDFGVSVTEIKDVIDYCIKIEMLFNKNGFVNSESLDERLAPVYIKRGNAKTQSAKQSRLNGSFCNSNAVTTAVSESVMPQSKVKEIKENKSKEDKEQENANKLASRAKLFEKSLIPFLGTYTKEMLREFADYWTEPNRSKTRMAFELKTTWDTAKRLATWAKRDNGFKPNQKTGTTSTFSNELLKDQLSKF